MRAAQPKRAASRQASGVPGKGTPTPTAQRAARLRAAVAARSARRRANRAARRAGARILRSSGRCCALVTVARPALRAPRPLDDLALPARADPGLGGARGEPAGGVAVRKRGPGRGPLDRQPGDARRGAARRAHPAGHAPLKLALLGLLISTSAFAVANNFEVIRRLGLSGCWSATATRSGVTEACGVYRARRRTTGHSARAPALRPRRPSRRRRRRRRARSRSPARRTPGRARARCARSRRAR